MERNTRLQAILEGKFLSLQSDISVEERPYVIPVHDPQESIAKSRYSKEMSVSVYPASSVYDPSEVNTVTDFALSKPAKGPQKPTLNTPLPSFHYQHESVELDDGSSHPPPYFSPRRWPPRTDSRQRPLAARASRRLSITPSLMDTGYIGPNQSDQYSPKSRKIISEQPGRISPMHVVKLPDRFTPEPPNNGTMAWLQVLAGFFVIMDAQGLNQSYGVFQAYYSSILLPTHTPSALAWIGSLQIFLLFFMSIFVSSQLDKNRFQHCFTGGSILLTLSVLATSFCKRYWQFVLAQGVGTGMGMGLVFGAGAPVLVGWFSSSEELAGWLGIATGLASGGGSVGGMVFPAICDKLILKIGFSWTVRVVALVVLITLIPANLIARERPGVKRRTGKPSFDWDFLTDVPYMLVMAGLFFTFWGIYFGFYYIVLYAEEMLHLSPKEAVNLLILMNAANLPGRFLPPLISDACLGPLNTLIPSTFLTSCLLFLWLGSSTSTSIHLVACFYGFAAAGVQSLYNAVVWGILKPNPASVAAMDTAAKPKTMGTKANDDGNGLGEEFGAVGEGGKLGFDEGKARMKLALVFAMIGIACLTGTPLGGQILGQGKGSWVGAQVFAGSSVAVGGVLLVGARCTKEGWGSGRV